MKRKIYQARARYSGGIPYRPVFRIQLENGAYIEAKKARQVYDLIRVLKKNSAQLC